MKKLNQKGFSPAIIILLLLILILAIIGWWVANQSGKDNSSSNDQPTASANKPQKAEEEQTKYLEIKEFGIKLPLSDNIETAYYEVREQVQADPAEYVEIFDKGFDGTKNKNGDTCKDTNFPLFVIGRVKSADLDKIEGPDKGGYVKLAFINNYLFYGAPAAQADPMCMNLTPNGPSVTTDANVEKIYKQKRTEITDSYKSVEKL